MAVSLREVICFGRYEPLFRVAAGGMAEVYAARIQGEAGFQKLVAVKRMLPHLASEPGFVDMFLNEAKLAAHVASPHVVQTLDLGRGSDGSLYIVMELVVGLSLAKLVEGHPGPLPIPVVVELLAQAAQGLDDAHEAATPAGDPLGLIHRDVSPHNVIVGVDGRARVTDFGIARAVNRPRPETNIRELKGKFAYMSPEQTRLMPLDRRSDVFSLGVIGWELLTGERLFAHRDPLEAVRLVQHKPVPAPTALRADVPPGIGEVILRALERDRGARVQSAGELALLLRRAARASYGEPPHKKEITAFVEHGGGEDLSRLQRLIRLGTEGAGAEAIEAVQPGVTRVLPEDASGVAPVGTGARRTAVLDSGAEELGPPTVMIVSDPAAVPETRLVRTAEVRADPYADETRSVRSAEVPTDPYVPETRADTARDEPVTRPSRAADDLTAQVTRVATPLAKAARREPSRGPWIAVAAIICALSFGAGLALVVVWPSDPPAAVLPAVVPTPQAPAPPLPTPVVREVAPDPPPPAQARPAAESEPAPPALEAEEPTTSSRARRVRRRRAPSAPAAEPPPPARPSGAPLLDVTDFDRRPR